MKMNQLRHLSSRLWSKLSSAESMLPLLDQQLKTSASRWYRNMTDHSHLFEGKKINKDLPHQRKQINQSLHRSIPLLAGLPKEDLQVDRTAAPRVRANRNQCRAQEAGARNPIAKIRPFSLLIRLKPWSWSMKV